MPEGLGAVAFESVTSDVQDFMLILYHGNSAERIDLECLGKASKLYLCALRCNVCPSVSAQLLDIIKILCSTLTTDENKVLLECSSWVTKANTCTHNR